MASMSGDRLTYQPFHSLYQDICEEATFNEAAEQSVFDFPDSTEHVKPIDPLAFAEEAFTISTTPQPRVKHTTR